MKKKFIPLAEFPYDTPFAVGTILREYNVGMNVPKVHDYYDYLIACLPWEKDFLVAINISEDNSKCGFALTGVLHRPNNKFTFVTRKEIEFSFVEDIRNWFIQPIIFDSPLVASL